MAKIAIKALVVMTLVCLVFDWSHAMEEQNYENKRPTTMDMTKENMNKMMNNIKKSATDNFRSVKEAETTQKVTSFFGDAFSKLKNIFSSTKTNPDDKYKQDAIKAFDEYAINHKKN